MRGNQRPRPAPEPFEFVPLAERVNRKSPIGHDRYDDNCITGQIHGTIEALSPIYVGSGVMELTQDGQLVDTIVRRDGKVAIPGSSLKGAIRSVLEAISESCVCKSKIKVRRQRSECKEQDNLCVACRIFGAMGFQGNIAIQDAPHIDGKIVTKRVPALYSPQLPKNEQEAKGRKFYMHGKVATGEIPMETCEQGSKFKFTAQIDNLTNAEWGLFFTALGHHPEHPFKLKIGGAKPVCLGSVDFQIEKIHIHEQIAARYLTWDSQQDAVKTGEALKTWKDQCITQATESLIQVKLLEKLADILKYE